MSTGASLKDLESLLKHYTPAELARQLEVSESTVRRWVAGTTRPQPYIKERLEQLLLPFQPEGKSGDFTFIDLFAGIGGLRMAFESIGGQCVFSSEWDSYARKTYCDNFPSDHEPSGDITKLAAEEIPDHDLLVAGFPCQPFSIAGVSKKNALGRAHGFLDEAQGTLFFDVARIIAAKRPKAFLLENVKNLQTHDKGRTFEVIRGVLTQDLGYHIFYRIIDGQHFVPQHRERIAIVGFREEVPFSWEALSLPAKGLQRMRDILHREDGGEPFLEWDGAAFFSHDERRVNPKYTLTPRLWAYLKAYAAKHRAAGNGFGYGLVGPDDIARTLSARYYKDGSEILVSRGAKTNPRRLTPRECARLMGLPDSFRIPVSDTRAYKQFGNSVVMPAFKAVARVMRPFIVEAGITGVAGARAGEIGK